MLPIDPVRQSFLEMRLRNPAMDGQAVIKNYFAHLPKTLQTELIEFSNTDLFEEELSRRRALQVIEEQNCGGWTREKLAKKIADLAQTSEQALHDIEDSSKMVTAAMKIAGTYLAMGEFLHGSIQTQNMRHSIQGNSEAFGQGSLRHNNRAEVVVINNPETLKQIPTEELKKITNMSLQDLKRHVPTTEYSESNIIDAESWESL